MTCLCDRSGNSMRALWGLWYGDRCHALLCESLNTFGGLG